MGKGRKCECGCSKLANIGRRFIRGHNQQGKKHSLETCKKMSAAHEGKIVSEETKKKISIANKGKIISDETKKKISKMLKGHIVSEVSRNKISKAKMGHLASEEARKKNCESKKENDSESRKNWNKYHPHIEKYQYRHVQNEVRKRDRFCCVVCNSKKTIATHHVIPVRVGYKSRLCDHVSNMIMLCKPCHGVIETGGGIGFDWDKWKEFLPFAKKYLSQFGYKEILLNDYV